MKTFNLAILCAVDLKNMTIIKALIITITEMGAIPKLKTNKNGPNFGYSS